jgi:hypothetical protein
MCKSTPKQITQPNQITISMGYLNRKPGIDEPEPSKPDDNPWRPQDEMSALLNFWSFRCCVCNRVIARQYLTIRALHGFCPDCVDRKAIACNGNCSGNMQRFLRHNTIDQNGKVSQTPGCCGFGVSDDNDAD